MPPQPRNGTLSSAGAMGLVLGSVYFVASLVQPTWTLWYLPISRQFHWGFMPHELGMDFFGRFLFAAIVALTGASLSAPIFAKLPWKEDVGLILGSFALITLWVLGFILTFSLGTRVITL